MKKWQDLQRISAEGLIAVIRARTTDEALKLADALQDGGIHLIEVTFTVPGALDAIRALKAAGGDLLIGAGTVLDSETARMAILAGADFVVSPCLDLETVRLCNRYQKVVMPGAMTVKEVVAGLEAGADIIKLFPGDVLGPQAVKSFRGPLPQAPLLPTGGVSLDNVAEWFAAGVVGVGVGGELTKEALVQNDFSLATETARRFVAKVRECKAKYTDR